MALKCGAMSAPRRAAWGGRRRGCVMAAWAAGECWGARVQDGMGLAMNRQVVDGVTEADGIGRAQV